MQIATETMTFEYVVNNTESHFISELSSHRFFKNKQNKNAYSTKRRHSINSL